jgi:hypothetical protein
MQKLLEIVALIHLMINKKNEKRIEKISVGLSDNKQ